MIISHLPLQTILGALTQVSKKLNKTLIGEQNGEIYHCHDQKHANFDRARSTGLRKKNHTLLLAEASTKKQTQ